MASSRFRRLVFLVIALFGFFAVYKSLHYVRTERQEWEANNNGPFKGTQKWDLEVSRNVTDARKSDLLRAAMVALVRNSELQGIRSTIRQVDDRFNRNYNYPYVFLNDEDFTSEFKKGIRAITKAPVYFGKLPKNHWGFSPYVTEGKVKEALERNRDRYIYGGSYSYRLMCRYQSGFIHKHPLLKDLDYYWRIEPDVNYFCDLPYDPFRYMRDNGLVYGYTISPVEKPETVESLWDTTRAWIMENQELLPEKSFIQWVVNEKAKYTLCHFWSNFEIVDLSLYRSEAYESYFQHLDRAGGFFYERWGDAPVHSIAAAMLLRKDQIHWFEDIGYHHPGYTHCPRDPEMAARCTCNANSNYMYRSMCKRRFDKVDDIPKSQALILAQISEVK